VHEEEVDMVEEEELVEEEDVITWKKSYQTTIRHNPHHNIHKLQMCPNPHHNLVGANNMILVVLVCVDVYDEIT